LAQNNLERQLRAGIRAAQQGDQQRARQLLEDLLRRDRDNELAWIWMASIVQSSHERRICLEHVLKINPRNTRARDALNSLVGVIGQGTTSIDIQAIAAMAVNKLPDQPDRPAARSSTPSVASAAGISRRGGINRRQLFPILVVAAIVLGILAIGSLLLPSVLAPAATATPLPTLVAEVTDEVTEEARGPLPTPTFSGTLVTIAFTQPPTFTPTVTETPTNTPTATATLPPVDIYNLLFVAQQGSSSPSLFGVNASGANNVPLITLASAFDYSPASGRLVFVRGVLYDGSSDLRDEIFLATIDAPADAVQITRDEAARSYAPTISPDGRQIIFVSDRDGDPELYLYDVTSRVARPLTENDSIDTDPHWSPDGTRIVFASDRRTPGRTELFVLDLQADDPALAVTQLTDSRGSKKNPRWSPDSRQIAFAGESGNDYYIFVTDASGQRIRQISRIGGVIDTAPAWTLDGNYLLFVSNRSGSVSQMYISTLDGETIRRIPTDGQTVLSVQSR
jgi:hypothetical protein